VFRKTTNGYLVECGLCLSQEYATSIRQAKNIFDFHECSSVVKKVFDYALVEKTFDDTPRVIVPDRAF
jgi:hypothetical protein